MPQLSLLPRAAGLICATFLDTGAAFRTKAILKKWAVPTSSDSSTAHRRTPLPAHGREIERDWTVRHSGNYVDAFSHSESFFLSRQPRWESLHSVQTLAEFHALEKRLAALFPLGPNVFPPRRLSRPSAPAPPPPVSTCSTRWSVWSTFFDPQNPSGLHGFALALIRSPQAGASPPQHLSPEAPALHSRHDRQVWSRFFDPKSRLVPWFALGPNVFPAGAQIAAVSTNPEAPASFVLGLRWQV